MRSCSSQKQNQPVTVYLIDMQPIGLNMTFTIATVVTGQQMISIFGFKRFSICKSSNDLFDFSKVISSHLRKYQILLELI